MRAFHGNPESVCHRQGVRDCGRILVIEHPLTGTPYGVALELCVALAAICWVLTLLTRDHSWVDRLWSIVPAVLCLIVAVDLGFDSPRVNIMTALAVLWGLRLTFNLALKGGYRVGSQDYRWTYLREQLGAVKFQLVNLTFIAFGQIAILWLFTSPVHQAWGHAEQPLGWLDSVAAVPFLLLLLTETIADAQMWRFQQNKKRLVSEGTEVRQPFMTAGLFRFCRHPSYACEMGMWAAFYLFAVSGASQFWHWTGLGCLALIVLFLCATRVGERVSSERYSGYGAYRAAVPMFVPNPFRFGRGAGAHSNPR